MFGDYRVVAVTPAGRQRYLEILAPYLIKNNIVDEWRLWINTTNEEDITYMKTLASDKIKLEYGNPSIPINQKSAGYSIYQYFKNCCDEKTIYIRFDDDICHIDKDAITNLLHCRVANPSAFLVFANIINNAIISHLYQRFGHISLKLGIVGYDCIDNKGWGDGNFAILVHQTFLDTGWPVMPNWWLNLYERYSINCFAFFGADFAKFQGVVDTDEEIWLSRAKPKELTRPNLVCGNAIVSHYAYWPQRESVEKTDILDRYRRISLDKTEKT